MGNIISLAEHIKQRKIKMEKEVENDAPFAESSAELIAEFLCFCQGRKPVLDKFCDILFEVLRNEAEEPLLDMIKNLKEKIALESKKKGVSRKKKVKKIPLSAYKKRIRRKRIRRRKS